MVRLQLIEAVAGHLKGLLGDARGYLRERLNDE
jgi:hypothetical protein